MSGVLTIDTTNFGALTIKETMMLMMLLFNLEVNQVYMDI